MTDEAETILRQARKNVAARLRNQAERLIKEAAAIEEGDRDDCWGIFHERVVLERETKK